MPVKIIDTRFRSKKLGKVNLKLQKILKSFSKADGISGITGQALAVDVQKQARTIINKEAHWTGDLAQSVVIKRIPRGNSAEFIVGPDSKLLPNGQGFNYARVIENGGRRHTVNILDKPVLQQWVADHWGQQRLDDIIDRGGFISVQHHGIHFMRRAFTQTFSIRKKTIKDSIDKALKTSGFGT